MEINYRLIGSVSRPFRVRSTVGEESTQLFACTKCGCVVALPDVHDDVHKENNG